MIRPKWQWRDFLSPDEAEFIAKVDQAKADWLELNKARASIKNRAVQRAMYDARKGKNAEESYENCAP